jgi:hypothetical protein
MQHQSDHLRQRHGIKHLPKINKSILKFVLLLVMFAIATPALADYLGPDRVVTETISACKVVLYECRYVPAKDDWRYKRAGDWSCSNESKPWQAYPDQPSSQGCFAATAGDTYWGREETAQEVITTYPPAAISSSLQNCTMNNGWCVTSPQLSLGGSEPVSGYSILAIEGTLNGQTFACSGANCSVPLNEGNNIFAYWALSSWGDSSTMGTSTTKVDTGLPNITGSFTGTLGSNGWYIDPVSFTGNASDATSGLASFTCTLDGIALGSCNSITVNSDGPHTIVLTARDNAGRTRTLSQSTSLDTQNPVLSAALSGMLGANNWRTTAELNANASDPAPGSGLAALEYNVDVSGWAAFPESGVLTLPDGKHNVDVRAKDTAGRTVSSSKSFWLDSIAPNITIDPSGMLGLNDWYTTDVNLAASASDATSGMDVFEYSLDNSEWTTYNAPISLHDGTHSLSFWAQDEAGLAYQIDRTYKVDTRAPQIGGSLSGVPGTNGWYISDVRLSASASDPAPGSGVDAFTYILNGGAETSYAGALTLPDGQHTVRLNAQDKAGLPYSTEQAVKVDTVYPSLNVQTTPPNWISNSIALNGTASDNGSGLSKVEISTDGGQTWQPVIGTASWGYTWNTQNSPNGMRDIHVRAMDNAGLITKRSFSAGVDNRAPKISLPDSWYQWDTVTLDIRDDDSGLSEARVEISDPEGRWPTRIIRLDLGRFPLDFKWDRRFRDDTIAPLGIYDVKVVAFDSLGNMARKSASIKILLDILPAGPTATPQPTSRPADAATPTSTQTAIPATTSTQTTVVSLFGATVGPTMQVTPTPESQITPRATSTQISVLDWLQSVFVPDPNTAEQATEVVSSVSLSASQSSGAQSNVLWGAAAAGVIGAATTYAIEEKRKRKEEEARQAEQVRATVDAKNAAIQASQQAKREALKIQNWLQGQANLNAHIEEAKKQGASDKQIAALKLMGATQGLGTAIDGAMNLAKSMYASTLNRSASANIHTARKEELVEEEMKALGAKLQEWETGYNKYMAQRAMENWRKGEQEFHPAPKEKSWWENTKSFVMEKILQPLDSYFYQPYLKPAVEKIQKAVTNDIAWANENVYQPYIKPALEKTKETVTNDVAWANENIYQSYVKPAVEKIKQTASNGISWTNENIYQPYVKPVVEKTKQVVADGIAWANEYVYQPYIQPVLTAANEKIYQPYIKPLLDRTKEAVAAGASWINTNIYQPYIEPVASDINQYIYQPYFKSLVDKASSRWENTWDQYGEWVHGGLDAAGLIPGLGEIADGLNGLIYLGEGRYIEASISAMAMIPILGDLGKAGKWSLKIGKEVLEEAAEKVAKEVAEELLKKAVKESLEEVAERVLKETGEELIEKTAKVLLEEVAEKTLREISEELVEKVSQTVAEKATKEVADEVATRIVKDTVAAVPFISTKKVSKIVAEETVEETLEQVNEEAAQLINSLTEKYGEEMVARFIPFCEKYGINPYDVLTRPPGEGQTLIGWGLGIKNPANPVNHPLVNLNLTEAELDNILKQSIRNLDSKVVVLGYGRDCAKPYYALGDEIEGCYLSLSAEAWAPFEKARANFWADINTPLIEQAVESRKVFLFNIEYDVITNPRNVERFSLPELRLIELEKNNYVKVPVGDYTALVPIELSDTYEQYLPPSLTGLGE